MAPFVEAAVIEHLQIISDAEGKKLNVTYGSPSKTINYSGNMVYENGTLSQILTEGGYVTLSGSTPTYHAYLRDHQGNNRVVIDGSGTIEQMTQYYPFGYFFGESTNASTQRYKYNDKEFDMMHGLHWYDYGARHYDPAIMRFTTIDPMCEKYYHLSPYAYCGNNPVNAVDINGDSIFYYMPIIEKGEIKGYTKYEYGKYGDSYGFGLEGRLYQGSNQTIAYMNNALNRLRNGGEVGRNLVDYLSGHTGLNVAIKYGDNETSFDLNNMDHNIEVSWNPLDTDGGLDVNGNYERPAYIGLAHELAHAYDMISNENIDESIWIPANGSYKAIGMFEKTACIIENKIRLENSLPQRAYYMSIGGKGYTPSKLPVFYPNFRRR